MTTLYGLRNNPEGTKNTIRQVYGVPGKSSIQWYWYLVVESVA